MGRKRAIITGITGQDGSYLAELLLDHGYDVHGIVRPMAVDGVLANIAHLAGRLVCHYAAIEDYAAVTDIIAAVAPDECYHLAAQTFIGADFTNEFATIQTNATGTHHILAALRSHAPACRMFFAGSSEMFGSITESPQTEETPFRPRTVYGVSKVTGYYLMRHYREAYKFFACCGILYNHESPRRGKQFVTRKITSTAVRIKAGLDTELRLGNLDALRDWGHAQDFVRAMWLMLQQPNPDDYILATGVAHSVRDFAIQAFEHTGLNWQHYVVSDPQFYRPAEAQPLIGSSQKARKQLGWIPQYDFTALVSEMVDHDREELQYELSHSRTDL
jgi:GDPmannose 4,6-dehydratase